MNQHLINHIDAKLNTAANFVCKFMPVDITVDSAYEAMLACSSVFSEATKDDMITAFQNAVKYLEPHYNFQQFNFVLPGGRSAKIQVRFNPTKKWPVFLIPAGDLVIDPESKLAALLDTPIRVATEWESLTYIWEQLRAPHRGLEPYVLAYLMPWIRECLADFDTTMVPIEVSRIERKTIEKELSTVMNDRNVTFFPRMSKALSETARSGRTLLSQYRMIDAAYSDEMLTQSPIIVERTPSLLEPWLKEHLDEALNEWQEDKAQRTARQLQAIIRKANSKGK